MTTKFRTLLILSVTLLTGLLGSCAKEIDTYEDDPRLYFFERATDLVQTRITSKSFSFLSLPAAVVTDTVKIKVKTMGLATSYDRVLKGATIATGTTATEGVHYVFLNGMIKAGQVEGFLPVLLNRTTDIRNTSLTLNLTIAANENFKPGVVEDQTFTLSWSEDVVKPTNWDTLIGLSFYFGPYSKEKFRFVVNTTGISDFPLQQSGRVPLNPGEYSNSMMNDIKLRVKEALATYNATHAVPLTDETGTLITFPN
ncbi:DUF4843 domain-containing protein [Pedobacter sp. MR2016-24]|uniref:DUF4843 domain-containing protein n=1 Tax=Pedobacter sp. MR2016-24 TaxID=2994466 RepID=UPI00224536B4|nr:DUF4843 domain-containing protein [Pedobacter sp. MR2016-24]MCX2483161.1 DUF4843 domain-containing protein [Pedobacter sp. MR2016-24]